MKGKTSKKEAVGHC